MREVVNPEGFGGILVGIRKVEDPDKWFLPRAGVSAPVTVIADFENKSPATYDVTLTWYDPTRRDRALVASRERPLRCKCKPRAMRFGREFSRMILRA